MKYKKFNHLRKYGREAEVRKVFKYMLENINPDGEERDGKIKF